MQDHSFSVRFIAFPGNVYETSSAKHCYTSLIVGFAEYSMFDASSGSVKDHFCGYIYAICTNKPNIYEPVKITIVSGGLKKSYFTKKVKKPYDIKRLKALSLLGES